MLPYEPFAMGIFRGEAGDFWIELPQNRQRPYALKYV